MAVLLSFAWRLTAPRTRGALTAESMPRWTLRPPTIDPQPYPGSSQQHGQPSHPASRRAILSPRLSIGGAGLSAPIVASSWESRETKSPDGHAPRVDRPPRMLGGRRSRRAKFIAGMRLARVRPAARRRPRRWPRICCARGAWGSQRRAHAAAAIESQAESGTHAARRAVDRGPTWPSRRENIQCTLQLDGPISPQDSRRPSC